MPRIRCCVSKVGSRVGPVENPGRNEREAGRRLAFGDVLKHPSQVGALEVNGFDGSTDALQPRLRELIARRDAVLGPAYHLMYEEPVELVEGHGAHLIGSDGRRYLDMYNNVAGVGHSNPRVRAAVDANLAKLNTHTRYLHESVVSYAERLTATMPDGLDTAMFTCTGSEANDLALRIVRRVTGQRGVIVTRNAYHGGTLAVAACSPSMGSLGSAAGSEPWVEIVECPDTFRHPDDVASWWASAVADGIAALESRGEGVAALLVDSAFTSDGVHTDPAPFLGPAVDAVRRAGGLLIADEVQPGFGRLGGRMWGFERHGVLPDLVTLGKPMGNGIPIGGVVAQRGWIEKFAGEVRYFNTFGGNPVAIAAASAVLDEIEERSLLEHVAVSGARLVGGLREASAGLEYVGDVRGSGLFVGVEFVDDPVTRHPDPRRAIAVVNAMRDAGVLISATGYFGNTLKIRPPMVIELEDLDRFVTLLHDIVRRVG